MKASVEISMYPLKEGFVEVIKDFIERLNAHPDIIVETNGMSTQVFGEYDDVMSAVQKEIKISYQQNAGIAIFVMKVVNAFLQE